MGQIVIQTLGSFGVALKTFSAEDGGHAHALSRAIAYISGELMPKAIVKDHALHDTGDRPPRGDFGHNN